jgi:drug/metabolite transporter (DMT)-like permease
MRLSKILGVLALGAAAWAATHPDQAKKAADTLFGRGFWVGLLGAVLWSVAYVAIESLGFALSALGEVLLFVGSIALVWWLTAPRDEPRPLEDDPSARYAGVAPRE